MKLSRWHMLAAHVCINFVLGGVYAFSFFRIPLIDKFSWDSVLIALAFSINMGIIPIPMIIGGKMIDNGKGKHAIVLGCILFSIGFVLSGFATELWHLFITYGLIAGFGSGLAFTGNLNNIMKFFPDKRGLASGIVLSGVGIGTLICTKLAEYFMTLTGNISQSLLYLGIIYLVVLFIVQFFIRSAPAKDSGNIQSSPFDMDYKAMLRESRFWILLTILAFGVFTGVIISSASAQIGIAQYHLANGALIVSLVSIFNSFGRIFWGGISDKLGSYLALRLVYIMLALCMLILIIFSGSAPAFYIAALGTGFAYAGVLTIFPAITSQNFGLKNQGLNYGFMYSGFAIGSIISPYVTSALADVTGNYSIVFMIAIIVLCMGLVLLSNIEKRFKKLSLKKG